MWYSFWMTNRWLLVHFDFLSGLAVLVTSLFSIALLTDGAGLAGITITSAMAFTQSGKSFNACIWLNLKVDCGISILGVSFLDRCVLL
jgi:hypothetical protein